MRWVFFVLTVTAIGFADQKLNIQVSDPQNHPLRGLKITTKCPGTTEVTDDGGKATITFQPITEHGPVELTIISPANFDFISPWQRSVTVPPDYWPIVVAPHGERAILEHPHVVTALAARASSLQIRTAPEDPPPSKDSLKQAIADVATEYGLPATEVTASFDRLPKTAKDDYSRGIAFLVHQQYLAAVPLLKRVLSHAERYRGKPQHAEEILNATFFLGQAEFELGHYREAAAAYHRASQLRQNDAIILNNEGLSFSKAGDFSKAEQLYQKALEIMQASGRASSVDYSTTTNNLAATLAYQGEFEKADQLFANALALRRHLLNSNDLKIAISLNNVAAMKITEGKCLEAQPLLEEAIQIQGSPERQEETLHAAGAKALMGTPTQVASPRGLTAVPPDRQQFTQTCAAAGSPPETNMCRYSQAADLIGFVPLSSSPGIFTTRMNQAMLSFCLQDYESAFTTLVDLLNRQHPSSDVGNIYLGLARVTEALDRHDEALVDYEESIKSYIRVLGSEHPVLVQVYLQYGKLLLQMGKMDQARAAFRSALEVEQFNFGIDSRRARVLAKQLSTME